MYEPPEDDPWHGCNPTEESYRNDPYPSLRHLRETAPVSSTPIGVWRLTRYADVVRLLREAPSGVRTTGGELPFVDESSGGTGPSRFMLQQDPNAEQVLIQYIAELESKTVPPPFMGRLEKACPTYYNGMISHVSNMAQRIALVSHRR